MIVLMVGIVMAVWVRVAGSVRVLVFVLVEYDLQAPAERISDAAQRLQAWNMIAAFEARSTELIRSLRRGTQPDATAWCVGTGWWLSTS